MPIKPASVRFYITTEDGTLEYAARLWDHVPAIGDKVALGGDDSRVFEVVGRMWMGTEDMGNFQRVRIYITPSSE